MDPLSENLKAWKVNPPIHHGFRRAVWAKIAARQSESWVDRILGLLSCPKPTMASLSLCLLLGVGTGWIRSNTTNERNLAALKSQYIQSITPPW